MKKTLIVLSSVLIFFFTSTLIVYAQDLQDTRERKIQEFLLMMLYPYIDQAIEEYYGKPKQYEEAKIIDIKRLNQKGQYSFEIKVQVRTFEGPHNPPYGLETITMENDLSRIIITKLEHKNL